VSGRRSSGNGYLYHYFKQAWWSGSVRRIFSSTLTGIRNSATRINSATCSADTISPGSVRGSPVGVREREEGNLLERAYAAAFQLQIEIFDGQFKKYGFSYADMIANTTGQDAGGDAGVASVVARDQAHFLIS